MGDAGFIITNLPHKTLGGGAYAMRKFSDYEGSMFWRVHAVYKGYRIMRAYHADNQKPCALYCFRLDEDTLIVRENLAGIKEEASQYAEGRSTAATGSGRRTNDRRHDTPGSQVHPLGRP